MPIPFDHHSVLLPQTIDWLCPTIDVTKNRYFVDCTVGGAGHSMAILDNHPLNQLLCIDRDAMAIQVAQERLSDYGDRVHIKHGAFADVLQTMASIQLVVTGLGFSRLRGSLLRDFRVLLGGFSIIYGRF